MVDLEYGFADQVVWMFVWCNLQTRWFLENLKQTRSINGPRICKHETHDVFDIGKVSFQRLFNVFSMSLRCTMNSFKKNIAEFDERLNFSYFFLSRGTQLCCSSLLKCCVWSKKIVWTKNKVRWWINQIGFNQKKFQTKEIEIERFSFDEIN